MVDFLSEGAGWVVGFSALLASTPAAPLDVDVDSEVLGGSLTLAVEGIGRVDTHPLDIVHAEELADEVHLRVGVLEPA